MFNKVQEWAVVFPGGGWGSRHMGVRGCIGPGGEGGGGRTGVVTAAGREFLAACKIPHILFLFPFFFFFFYHPVHNQSRNHDPTGFAARPGIGGRPVGESAGTEMCETGPCGFVADVLGDSGTSSGGWKYG